MSLHVLFPHVYLRTFLHLSYHSANPLFIVCMFKSSKVKMCEKHKAVGVLLIYILNKVDTTYHIKIF